jgi:hypothetical protein
MSYQKTSCSCGQSKQVHRGSGCFQGCESPEQKNPFCSEKPRKTLCFEETCEEESFDAKQIRYRSGCVDDEESPLINLNIGLGENLEYIIDNYGRRLMDLDYAESPKLEEYPELDTLEKQIIYLLERVKQLSLTVEQQHCRILKLENK